MDQRKNQLITNRITVYGMVQGVGFRPLVYHIAEKYKIKGNVRNLGGSVEIIAQAKQELLQQFITELSNTEDGGHVILQMVSDHVEPHLYYESFTILDSNQSNGLRILPPDLPTCTKCSKELFDPEDRRYRNPFISCVACGPRYTIMEDLPYDRETTSMVDFEMCNECHEEYTSAESRRHHAQTISCHDCGPYLIYEEANQAEGTSSRLFREQAFEHVAQILQAGGIVAVKGIGGYHFVCSPFLELSVQKLRLLKGREEKPFAVMFENIAQIKEYCVVSEEEEQLLLTSPRPIVLLAAKQEMAPSVNKGSLYCGSFLPYTPLQRMLLRECGPLIMTSGNISGQPILREDREMLQLASPHLQGILYNTRRILRSVDDSVAKILDHKPLLIRRSRGYAPYPIFIKDDNDDKECEQPMIFAAGGDLKAAFCLYRKGAAFVSQYFGDLEEAAVMEEFVWSAKDLEKLLMIIPTLAVCDLHPNYFSSRYAKELGLPILEVQHHHAHIASVMAEHSLEGPVIGVAYDGTGYGTDGKIWGGEFLLCEGVEYQRAAHLNYLPILGGDQSMKDARKTATCYLSHLGLTENIRDDRGAMVGAALKQNINCVQTSSMGRLFDAVASILSVGHFNRYEGECATLLEQEAILAIRNQIPAKHLTIAITVKNEIIDINMKPLLEQLCSLRDIEDVRALALGFHYAIADMTVQVCELLRSRYETSQVALSGGVFVNSVLTERIIWSLRERGFQIFRNMEVPPGDGGISLGQTYLGKKLSRNILSENDSIQG